MGKLSAVVALLAAMTLAANAAALTAPAGTAIGWERDFKAAARRAQAEGRPLMVAFWATWCPWCRNMEETTYRAPRVISLAGEMVAVKVDIEGSLAEKELAARYAVEILPTVGFLSPAGRLFLRVAKFEGPDSFPATLERVRGLAREVASWEAALTRNEKDPAALAGLGALLLEQGLFLESRELLQRARKGDRDRPAHERKRTRRNLARVERERGKRGGVPALLEEALAIQPAEPEEDSLSLFAMGEAYLEQGQLEKARQAWERSRQSAPRGPGAALATEALAHLPGR